MAIASPSRRAEIVIAGIETAAAVDDSDAKNLVLADDPKTRRLDKFDAAVALALMAGDQRVQRRLEAQGLGLGGNVVDETVGDEDRRADPVGGYVFQRLRQRRKQQRAVGAGPDRNETRLDVGRFREGVFERLARRVDLRHAGAEGLALAAVEHDGDDALLRLALLAHQRRVGERREQQSEGQRPPSRALLPGVKREAENAERGDDQQREGRPRQQRREGEGEFTHGAPSLPQTLQQIAHMHLIGFIIAGQRVHHEIYAAAQ